MTAAFTRLSGFQNEELFGQNFAMGLAGYRHHFAGSGLIPAHVGMPLEYGQVGEDGDDLFSDALLAGVSISDTVLRWDH